MSISELDFNVQCHNFVRKCNEFGDCWSLYLSTGGRLRELNFGNMEAVGHQTDGKLMLRKTQVIPVVDTIHTNDFTVIYSESYEVPVLYFCISDRGKSKLNSQ